MLDEAIEHLKSLQLQVQVHTNSVKNNHLKVDKAYRIPFITEMLINTTRIKKRKGQQLIKINYPTPCLKNQDATTFLSLSQTQSHP